MSLGVSMGHWHVLQLLFCKNHKFINNSTSAERTEKTSIDLEFPEFYMFSDTCSTKLKNYQILLNKISPRFAMTTKLFRGGKNLVANIVSKCV